MPCGFRPVGRNVSGRGRSKSAADSAACLDVQRGILSAHCETSQTFFRLFTWSFWHNPAPDPECSGPAKKAGGSRQIPATLTAVGKPAPRDNPGQPPHPRPSGTAVFARPIAGFRRTDSHPGSKGNLTARIPVQGRLPDPQKTGREVRRINAGRPRSSPGQDSGNLAVVARLRFLSDWRWIRDPLQG